MIDLTIVIVSTQVCLVAYLIARLWLKHGDKNTKDIASLKQWARDWDGAITIDDLSNIEEELNELRNMAIQWDSETFKELTAKVTDLTTKGVQWDTMLNKIKLFEFSKGVK